MIAREGDWEKRIATKRHKKERGNVFDQPTILRSQVSLSTVAHRAKEEALISSTQ